MKIIIPRIPRSANRADLKRFVTTRIQRRYWFAPFSKPQLLDYQILRIRDRNGNVERHGIIQVVPEKAARQLIKSLHGSRFKGKWVGARRFVERKGSSSKFNRVQDRRRPNLNIEKEKEASTKGYVEFARKTV